MTDNNGKTANETPSVNAEGVTEEHPKGIFQSLANFILSLPKVLKETLDIRSGTDKKATITDIKEDISFKGHKAWILIASVFIASLGLNMNSPAVIIGAMLISPLMGPILGIGLSIGINDWETLKRSARNVFIAVVLSIITSFIYFEISPIRTASSELLARTYPTLLDVFVAFFGGMAGILAGSRGEKSNVVPGVAIATALMPPLCTAGYGLATFQWNYFLGAIYLFLLNSVFIALATLIVVKFLRFPIVSYINVNTKKKINQYITIFILLIIMPSGYLFYNVITKSIFERDVENYVSEVIQYPNVELISKKVMFEESKEGKSQVDLYFLGEFIPEKIQNQWKGRAGDYGLQDAEINFFQQKDNTESITGVLSEKVRVGVLEDIYKENEKISKSKDEKIARLEKEIIQLSKNKIPFDRISQEARLNHVKLESFGYSEMLVQDYKKIDTLPVFVVTWKKGINNTEKHERMEQLTEWLRFKLDNQKVSVIEGK